MKRLAAFVVVALLAAVSAASAASVTVTMYRVNAHGVGDIVGTIVFQDMAKGLKIMPNLGSLSEGQHGTHVHQNPSCGAADDGGRMVPGLAAGGHFDPKQTGKHEGPAGAGHLGDLPVLYVDNKGRATRSSYASRLTTADLIGRSIVIHAGGDNYADEPKKLGGGGSRAACGVVVD